MGDRFASGKRALGVCDICGFTFLLRELRKLVKKGQLVNIKACPECWNGDHPQNRLGEFPVDDPQALRDPRPDTTQFAGSRAIIIIAGSPDVTQLGSIKPTVVGTVFVGQVTVSIS
tara:strand:+ start:3720 stop:4067 length:348 start_codon:yes stop_codon:yes gene_type:complete